MEKVIIGERLGKRIKDMGYTQQKFAEMMGIRVDTLQSYIKGRNAYNYELLIEFAEKLDCSYDYLLGYSKSPKREYHEIAEQTRLSEKAIQKIVQYASHYDDNFEARRFIMSLDMILCEDGAFNSICEYFFASKFVDKMSKGLTDSMKNALYQNPSIKEIGMEQDLVLSLETQRMIEIIAKLKDLKMKLTPEFTAELKALDTEKDYQETMKKVEEYLHNLFVRNNT
ncbi:MAG: helix-turn-helix domain-containing protein [Lachnospiraceae bacterium]